MSYLVFCVLCLAADPAGPEARRPAAPASPKPPKRLPAPIDKKTSAASAKEVEDGEPHLDLWLRAYDQNHDGRLSKDEVPARLAKKFAKADRDHNGYLDASELLHGKNRVSALARKTENLRLGAGNRLVPRGPSGTAFSAASRQLLERLDANHDGAISAEEWGQALYDPAALMPPHAEKSPRPPELAADGLPTAEAILKNLDRNQDGVLDGTEAVDRLKQNFRALDKDKSGTLDRAELERGLKLARMFGIKPSADMRQFRRPDPPATPPATSARKGGYL